MRYAPLMLLDQRIERYLKNEHAAVRLAVAEATGVIDDLRSTRTTTTPAPQARRGGPLIAPMEQVPEPSRRRLEPHLTVQDAWKSFIEPLEAHLTREDRVLAVAQRVLGGDTKHRAAMLSVLHQFEGEHGELRRLAGHVRAAAMLHERARKPVVTALERYDEATRVQEIEIYPALLAGSELAFQLGQTPVPVHYQRSDNVLRSIRARSPLASSASAEPEAAAPADSGLIDRLRRLIGR